MKPEDIKEPTEFRLEIESHADGSAYIVDPNPMLRDPVNGNLAVVAKCKSVDEARQQIRKWKQEQS